MILFADTKGPDQPAQMCRLIWAFGVCICPKTCFHMVHQSFLYVCSKEPEHTYSVIAADHDKVLTVLLHVRQDKIFRRKRLSTRANFFMFI